MMPCVIMKLKFTELQAAGLLFYKEDKAQGGCMERAETYGLEKARLEGARYYDMMASTYARRITVPGWYSFGYNDEVVP